MVVALLCLASGIVVQRWDCRDLDGVVERQ